MNRVVLFNQPVFIPGYEDEFENRTLIGIYGFKLSPDSLLEKWRFIDYTEYLCGVSSWVFMGNSFKDDVWIENDGESKHLSTHPCIKRFQKIAKKHMGVKWMVIETNKDLDSVPEMMDEKTGYFVTSEKLYRYLMEYGKKVKIPNKWMSKRRKRTKKWSN